MKRRNNLYTAICIAIFLLPSVARAACVNPTGAVAEIAYSSAQNVPMYCNGSQWIAMGLMNPSAGGSGCPTVTMGVQPEGKLVYNVDFHVLQYCDGDNWQAAGIASLGRNFLGFTDVTDQVTSVQVTSNILQVTLGGSVSIAGDGSPEYRICADDACSSETQTWGTATGTIDSGEFLQLRLTSNASFDALHSATVTVGTAGDQWDVTTAGAGEAFPLVLGTNSSQESALVSSHVVALPADVQSGNLLVTIVCAKGKAWNTPAGWAAAMSFQDANVGFNVFYRIADGTEGNSVTISTSGSAGSAHTSYRITGYQGSPEATSVASSGNDTTPDPGSLTPSWGLAKTLWIAAACEKDPTAGVVLYPSGYTEGLGPIGADETMASAHREVEAGSHDPSVFTFYDSKPWAAATIAVRPQ